MFSGIVKSVGVVVFYDHERFRLAIRSEAFSSGVTLGASIAIDGVCLTACHSDKDVVTFDLGEETRRITLLASKKSSDLVNIEFSLRMGDALDGHMVQGHVDGLARLIEKTTSTSGNLLLRFSLPQDLKPFFVMKGSVAINGTSLTINELDDKIFSVCLVPFTVENTSFKSLNISELVHIETDMVGRYLFRFTTLPNLVKDNA